MVNILTHQTAFILKRHAGMYLIYRRNAENLNSVDTKTTILLADRQGEWMLYIYNVIYETKNIELIILNYGDAPICCTLDLIQVGIWYIMHWAIRASLYLSEHYSVAWNLKPHQIMLLHYAELYSLIWRAHDLTGLCHLLFICCCYFTLASLEFDNNHMQ